MTDAATTERMSRVDTAWLRMDSEANLMMIVGVWLLAPRLTLAELQQRIGEGLLAYPRFRQKVVEDAAGASWVTDGDFDIGHHVQREALHRHPGEAPLDALKRRVAELAASGLTNRGIAQQLFVTEKTVEAHLRGAFQKLDISSRTRLAQALT